MKLNWMKIILAVLLVLALLCLVIVIVDAQGGGYLQRCVSEHWNCFYFPMVLN